MVVVWRDVRGYMERGFFDMCFLFRQKETVSPLRNTGQSHFSLCPLLFLHASANRTSQTNHQMKRIREQIVPLFHE